ncbi:pre-mRNA cleavage complex II protein-like protein Clp1 [Byssothecium circinans]|uniref:Polynucleotide 5'-hydroxyl-kinase GRC3 n=1 Tax=Byssothecium circinans TaxID=147558 RepID=A0A6A5TTV2_9PLEO|nr:pre-mRNA cleavage complex II protein-like protein Clp1 [Byssothecium circinans]
MALPGLPGLPGLNLSAQALEALSQPPVATTRQQDLAANTEYRFEVGFDHSLTIKLLSGTAEFFGTELAPSQPYTFQGTKGAVFTWHGCKLDIGGDADSEYVAEETQMMSCANTHFALEMLRDRAIQVEAARLNGRSDADRLDLEAMGPRVLVVGSDGAGKTSFVKTLTSYAVKTGRQPIVVNLDPRQSMLSIPGSLTAAAFSSILDIEEGWGSSPISGPSPTPVKMPLVYHYGLENPEEGKLFKALVSRLATAVSTRLMADSASKHSGYIIDSPGVISQGKTGVYEIIDHIISELSVNILITIGSERLYSDLTRKYSSRTGDEAIHVLRLDKSGGCVDRSEEYMKTLRDAQVKAYFFGHSAEYSLAPHSQTADFDDLHIFRFIESIADLVGKLLALTTVPASARQEDIRDSSVTGYMWIANVDESRKKVKLLCPQPGILLPNALILGRWPEAVEGLLG